MNSAPFSLRVEKRVGILRMERPEKRNALDAPMLEALGEKLWEIEHRDDLEVLILTGRDKAFCAGGDIEAWSGLDAAGFGRHWIRDGHDIFDRLARLRQPVIAVLNGHALGGGLELAACADYRIAEDHVKIGMPEAGLGIIAGWSGTQRATRRFGSQWVRRMALFGEILTAGRAHDAGIVDQVAAKGRGFDCALELAEKVLGRGPLATELTKMMINAAEGEERERVLDSLAGRIAAASDELREGVAAFREKRSPDFRN